MRWTLRLVAPLAAFLAMTSPVVAQQLADSGGSTGNSSSAPKATAVDDSA